MGLTTGIYIGREAVVSESAALNTVADNLANMNTTGFKGGRAEFSELIAASVGGLYSSPVDSGSGVRTESISYSHELQGSIQPSERSLDVAVDGQGFFILNDGTENFYTRAGNFSTDSLGNIVSASGDSVMGYNIENPTTLVPLALGDIANTAAATTTGSIVANLNASSAFTTVPAAGATFAELDSAASFKSTGTIVDSLGAEHDVVFYFFHTANGAWTAQGYVDGADTGGTAGTPVQAGTVDLTFDSNGALPSTEDITLTLSAAWGNGAEASSVAIDMSGFSQLSASSAFELINFDGSRTGGRTSVRVDDDGNLIAALDNGEEEIIGQLALALFQNTRDLERTTGNRFRETDGTGAPDVGLASSNGRGSIVGGALENSNVDISREFVDLIRFQKAFQAGSQVVSTFSELYSQTVKIA